MHYIARLMAAAQILLLVACSSLQTQKSETRTELDALPGTHEISNHRNPLSSISDTQSEDSVTSEDNVTSENNVTTSVEQQPVGSNQQEPVNLIKAEAETDFEFPRDAEESISNLIQSGYVDAVLDGRQTTLSASSDLWERVRKGFKLDLKDNNHRIEVQVQWYAKHQAYLDRTFQRSSLYLHHIVTEAERRGIPTELALLPVVESAFDPFAYSHGRAAGIWQFIPGTGAHYGLRQTWWYDGRRDVVASTEAAFNYLEDMVKFFNGDWLLALASYNSGAGTVQRAIRKNKAKGKPTDYWHLDLPRETEAYVPKLIAISKLVADPQKNGVTLFPIKDEPYFDIVKLDSQIDLAQAAKLANIDVDELYILNPGYNQWATAPLGPHRLALPISQVEAFTTAYNDLPPGQRVNWTRYKIKSGDSLISIAKKFKTTPQVLKDVNKIRGSLIRQGQQLLIPSSHEGEDYYALSADNRLETKQARINSSPGTTKVEYDVKSGDTLWDLSRAYQVNVRMLAKWNGMAPGDVLPPGKKLVIWTKSNITQSAQPTPVSATINNREIIRTVSYEVRKGDSLYLIANKFNVSVNDLVKWNTLSKNSILRPGQRLKIHVDITEIK